MQTDIRSDNSLRVRFCNSAVLIWCDDPTLRRSIGRYFRHCLHPGDCFGGDITSVVTTYKVTTTENREWQLRCGHKLVYSAPGPFYIFIYLTRDVVAKLFTRCQQHVVFHAAGLARDQSGLILCGQSGSGKSTLAAWLTATGFDFLTDEIVAVTADSSEMSGLACPIFLKEGSAFVWRRWLGESADQNLIHFFDGAVWLDPELLRPHCVRIVADPQILIFPRYATGEAFTARPLSAAEAVFRLMPHLINFKNLPNRGFAAATRLARQITAYSLTYNDITLAANWIEQTMSKLSVQRIGR